MPSGEPIALPPAIAGVYGGVPPYMVPPGFLWRAQNVVGRHGRLVTRPGITAAVASGPGSRISGGAFFKGTTGTSNVIAATLTKWYKLSATAWTDISGAVTFTADSDNPTRFTAFQQGGVNYIIGTNNKDALYAWNGIAASIAALTGSPPTLARDITTIGNYVVVLNTVESATRFSVRVRWSDFNNKDNWPALNFADLVALNAGSEGVAVAALGRLQMGVYLDESVWVGVAQEGAFAFRFEMVAQVPGPCSPACLVPYGSQHYYLARDARIYRFDGYQCVPISDPIEWFLQTVGEATQFRSVSNRRAWGAFNPFDRNIWFFYPGPNNADPTLAVSYSVDTGAWYPHVYAGAMSAGWRGDELATVAWSDLTGTWDAIGPGTYPTWDSFGGTLQKTMFMGSVAGQVYRQHYNTDDAGEAIPAFVEYPPRPHLGLNQNHHIDGVEVFARRIPSGPRITVLIGKSEAQADFPDPASYVVVGEHDTDLVDRQKLDDNVDNLVTRFPSLRLEYSTHDSVELRGTTLYAWGEAVP